MCKCNSQKSFYTVNPDGLKQMMVINWELRTKSGTFYEGGSFGTNKFQDSGGATDSRKNIATAVFVYNENDKIYKEFTGVIGMTIQEILSLAGLTVTPTPTPTLSSLTLTLRDTLTCRPNPNPNPNPNWILSIVGVRLDGINLKGAGTKPKPEGAYYGGDFSAPYARLSGGDYNFELEFKNYGVEEMYKRDGP